MCQRAAHEGNVLHAWQTHICDKLSATAHKAVVFLAQDARTDSLFRHLLSPPVCHLSGARWVPSLQSLHAGSVAWMKDRHAVAQ
ncbi:hypothetical protein D9M68_461110 [compost metagenome]